MRSDPAGAPTAREQTAAPDANPGRRPRESRGQAKMHELNRRHLAAPYVVQLARLKTELIDRLRAAVDEWALQAVAVARFGSDPRRDAGGQ